MDEMQELLAAVKVVLRVANEVGDQDDLEEMLHRLAGKWFIANLNTDVMEYLRLLEDMPASAFTSHQRRYVLGVAEVFNKQ